jgi:hypothetical protein
MPETKAASQAATKPLLLLQMQLQHHPLAFQPLLLMLLLLSHRQSCLRRLVGCQQQQ